MLITQTNNVLERVAVHAIPIGIGGEAEGAIGYLVTAYEKESKQQMIQCLK